MFCNYCGREINEKSSFCPYCGKSTSITCKKTYLEKQKNGTTISKKRRLIATVVSAAIIAISLVSLFLIISNHRQSGESLSLTVEDANDILNSSLNLIFEGADEGNFLSRSLRDQISVQVESISKEEEQVLAKCQVTAPDYKKAITDFLDELEDGSPNEYSELMEKLNKKLKAADQMEKQFVIEFVSINESYEPVIPEDMVAFCNGNVQELIPLFVELLEGGI